MIVTGILAVKAVRISVRVECERKEEGRVDLQVQGDF